MTRLILSLMVSLLLFHSAEIYRWVNESRRVHLGKRSKDKANAELFLREVDAYNNIRYGIACVVKMSQHIFAEIWCSWISRFAIVFSKILPAPPNTTLKKSNGCARTTAQLPETLCSSSWRAPKE